MCDFNDSCLCEACESLAHDLAALDRADEAALEAFLDRADDEEDLIDALADWPEETNPYTPAEMAAALAVCEDCGEFTSDGPLCSNCESDRAECDECGSRIVGVSGLCPDCYEEAMAELRTK